MQTAVKYLDRTVKVYVHYPRSRDILTEVATPQAKEYICFYKVTY